MVFGLQLHYENQLKSLHPKKMLQLKAIYPLLSTKINRGLLLLASNGGIISFHFNAFPRYPIVFDLPSGNLILISET